MKFYKINAINLENMITFDKEVIIDYFINKINVVVK